MIHFFFGQEPITRDEVESMILRLVVGEGNDAQSEETPGGDFRKAFTSLVGLYNALFVSDDEEDGEYEELLLPDEVEEPFRVTWRAAYMRERTNRGYPARSEDSASDAFPWDSCFQGYDYAITPSLLKKIATVSAQAEVEREIAMHKAYLQMEAEEKAKKKEVAS